MTTQNGNSGAAMTSINVSRAWQLRQKMIAEEVCRRGDFDNDEINRKVREMLKNEEDFVVMEPKKETVVDAIRRVIK